LSHPIDLSPEEEAAGHFSGAEAPTRRRSVQSHGLRLVVSEWGDEAAPPLLLAHGGFDFSRTFDRFAPLLARGGFRVVSWDQRGHGDSDHAPLYSWDADVRDLLAVMDSIGAAPIPVIGHSKGGSILTHLIQACPHRVSHFVNIDGIPFQKTPPDVQDHERTKLLARELSGWLDHRAAAATKVRRPGSLDELARRRGRMNPRLSLDWLRYLVRAGARKDPGGWRWKIDPALRPGGFGPWRANWTLGRLASLPVPMLAILAREEEPMGWETTEADVAPFLPARSRAVSFETGHFIHIEKPAEVAALVLEHLS